MLNSQSQNKQLDSLKQSIDILIIIELCKAGATRDEIRRIVGTLDNNLFAKINKVTTGDKK